MSHSSSNWMGVDINFLKIIEGIIIFKIFFHMTHEDIYTFHRIFVFECHRIRPFPISLRMEWHASLLSDPGRGGKKQW